MFIRVSSVSIRGRVLARQIHLPHRHSRSSAQGVVRPTTSWAYDSRSHASQAVFARFLGVSRNTVRSWEQGVNAPSTMACRFLDEIRLNPAYWQQRLRDSAKVKSA